MTVDEVQIVFADLQPTRMPGCRTISSGALTRSAVALAEAGKLLQIPMTFSLIPEGGEPGKSIPELESFITKENCFHRNTASIFSDKPTAAALAAHHRRSIVLSGFAAEVVVGRSALGAIEAGYQVQVPVDAVGALSDRTEAVVFRQVERAGGVTTCVSSVLATLAPDFSEPSGAMIRRILGAMRPAD